VTQLFPEVAAMMLNLDAALSPWEIRDIMVKTADPITPTSGGIAVPRLNAYRAVRCAGAPLARSTTTLRASRIDEWNCVVRGVVSASGSRQSVF
jgi:hypothetical protein